MTVKVAIVGHAADKFTQETEALARYRIGQILTGFGNDEVVMVSGGCHLGGIDLWADEEAKSRNIPTEIYLPKQQSWSGGYKERNLQIADACTEAHCIVVRDYPDNYNGMTFKLCYHCRDKRDPHVKSGGCWTLMKAEKLGKPAFWHIL